MVKGGQRRQTIIDTAERLFYKKGYEQTSVQDIIDALNYSKGGFYHHFDSKLALLCAICESRAARTREAVEEAVANAGGDPVDQLNAFFESGALFREDNLDYLSLLLRVAYRDDASLMREKIKEYSLNATLPTLDKIILAGSRERVFLAPHQDLLGELILRLVAQLTDDLAFRINAVPPPAEDDLLPLMLDKLELYRHAVERVLEAPFGSVVLMSAQKLAATVRIVYHPVNRPVLGRV
ncbi:MAG: TetR/AcrR family transcriptional regulator [Oscillospiraceae bacterium]|jgi:AcrR family transcriptional regulator|nr:TetR/AcrR family transcriptional regulator [Oscillospiraceae bacterium]